MVLNEEAVRNFEVHCCYLCIENKYLESPDFYLNV